MSWRHSSRTWGWRALAGAGREEEPLRAVGMAAGNVAAFAGILLLLLIPTLFISKVDPAKTVKAE